MAIQYQWQVSTDNGTTFNDIASDTTSISGTKTSKLIVTNLTTQNHKYQYRVRVSDTDLTVPPVVSRPAILYAAPTVIFLPDPTDQNTSNGSASFGGQASVDRGEILSYQWQRRSSSSASFINLTDVAGSVTGSKTNALSLAGLTSTNNGNQYRLVVTAQCCGTGPISYSSSVAQLNITGAPQSLWINSQPANTSIGSNSTVSFTVVAKIDNVPLTDPPPTLNVLWQEIGANGSITDLTTTGSTSFNRSGTTITYTHTVSIPNTAVGKNYRAILSATSSSAVTATATVLDGATACTSCGGSGHGDPHYYFGIPAASWFGQAGFDDNKDDASGLREILMLYIRDKNTNIEYILSTKNTPTGGSGFAPFNVGRTSARAYKDGVLIGDIVNDNVFDMMGVIKVTARPGTFGFEWSILRKENLNKIANLNIEMGGAWYWMIKSYIQYVKQNPKFMSLGWPWIAFIRGDGISLGLAPYGLSRSDFELNEDQSYAGDPKNIIKLRSIIRENTVDDMTQNFEFWGDLSKVLQGKLGGSSSALPIVTFTTSPKDTIAINGTASFSAILSNNTRPVWQKSLDSGKTWTDMKDVDDGENIVINVVRTDNGNLYRAVSNDRSAISSSAKLVVPQTIVVAKEPSDQNSKNLSATFSVVATGVPPIIYQWEKSDDNGLNYNSISKAVLPILQLDNLNVNDNGDLYRVVIQDGSGDLYTSGGSRLIIDPVITITQQPQDTTADNDEQASFSVQASCDNGGIQYRWQVSENNGQSYINLTPLDSGNNILNLSNLKIADNNKKYRAQIITDIRSNVLYSNPATLTVPSSITINSWPTNQLSVSGQAIFNVSATSTQPPLTYQWQTSEPNLSPRLFTNIVDATGATYVATGLSLYDDNRYYRVILEDQRGPIISPAVFVDTTPQITITQQPASYIPYDYNLFLATEVTTTNGVLEYSWQKAEPQSNSFNAMIGENQRILEIPIYPADSGSQYRARISVSGARDSYTNTVKIDVPPSISLFSKLQKATKISFPNKNITLSIDASSVRPPLNYQWQKSSPTKTSIIYTYDKNDIFYDYTQLLLEMNGDNGSKTITDSSKNNLVLSPYINNTSSNSANIALSTTTSKSGNSSLLLGERGCLRVTDTSGLLEFGTKDFTIECWCYPTSYAEMAIISRRLGDRHPNYGNEGWALTMNRFRAKLNSTWNDNWINDSLDNIPLNEWSHIALTRRGSTYRLFRNGSLVQSFINDGVLDETSGSINIGISKADNHENQFNGYLDRLRVTIGLARYVNSFNPEFVVDTDYDAYYNGQTFENIPLATGSVLSLTDLGDINNYERYRVVLTDSVSTVIVEDDT